MYRERFSVMDVGFHKKEVPMSRQTRLTAWPSVILSCGVLLLGISFCAQQLVAQVQCFDQPPDKDTYCEGTDKLCYGQSCSGDTKVQPTCGQAKVYPLANDSVIRRQVSQPGQPFRFKEKFEDINCYT